MKSDDIVSSPRDNLSPGQSLKLATIYLELATIYLENANSEADNDIALVLCHNIEALLIVANRDGHEAVRDGVDAAYISLREVIVNVRCRIGAQTNNKKAGNTVPSVEGTLNSAVDSMAKKPPHKRPPNVAVVSPHIFAENISPPTIVSKLPEADERLENTSQLACCLSILRHYLLDETLKPMGRNWLQAVENDSDEQERIKLLATDVVREFKNGDHNDAKAISEVVCLSPALEKDAFRGLLIQFCAGITKCNLVDLHQLDGLARLIQGADPDYLEADDLVKILDLLSKRLEDTHQQSPRHIYQLTMTASRVLDAMADTKVKDLDREKLHEPLSSYLNALRELSEPYL
ncbi:hypothetical protein BGZ65_002441, partial [Modicella reniformis]